MKWLSNLDRKYVVPILIGISLTTITCVSLGILLYPMFEKDETKDDSDKKSRQIVTSRCTTVQYKVPKQFASAIIGRGGSVIRDIESKTGTHINMNTNDIESPYAICIIRGNEMEGIRLAESIIKNILDNQPIIETYELFVPLEACGNLKRNGNIQQIQRSSGAKLIIENNVHKTEAEWKRRIIIKGSAEQIALAVTQIQDKIREENEAQAQLKGEQAASARIPRLSPNKSIVEGEIEEINPTIKTYEIPIPYEMIGEVIGTNENTVQQLERVLGVEIIIEKNPIFPSNERSVILRGAAKQLSEAIAQIKAKIEKENKTKILLNDDLTANKIRPTVESSSNDSVSISNNTLETSETFLPQDEVIEVFVSAVETPNKFWIHVIGPGIQALDDLVSEMTEYYNKAENRELHSKTVIPNQIVAAKFDYDKKWYRAQVLSIEDSQCKVFYVDYGDIETISINDVLELRTDMLCLRLQAINCSLANTKPRESEWNPEACDKFADLTHTAQWKPLIAKIKSYKYPMSIPDYELSHPSIPCIELYEKSGDKNIDIRETLIRLELARLEFDEDVFPTTNSRLLQDKYDIQSVSSSLLAENDSDIRDETDSSTC